VLDKPAAEKAAEQALMAYLKAVQPQGACNLVKALSILALTIGTYLQHRVGAKRTEKMLTGVAYDLAKDEQASRGGAFMPNPCQDFGATQPESRPDDDGVTGD